MNTNVSGQLYRVSSLTPYNQYATNAAYGGFKGSLYGVVEYRTQWQNLVAQPNTQAAYAHMPLYILNGGAGLKIIRHGQGHQEKITLEASYNYVQDFGWALGSIAASLGAYQYRLNTEKLRTPDGVYTDNTVDHKDDGLALNQGHAISMSYGLSSYFMTPYFEAGVAVQMLPNTAVSLTKGDFKPSTIMDVYFNYNFKLNEWLNLRAVLCAYTDFRQVQVESFALAEYSGNIFGGIGIRGYSTGSVDAFMTIVGWKFNEHLSINYAYDWGLSSLRSAHNGTHELQLTYNLRKSIGKIQKPRIMYNPRFM